MAKYKAKGTSIYYGTGANPTTVLVIGQRYIITLFVAGDSFTNVGAGSNATGIEFTASGTTPTTWANGSTVASAELVTQVGDVELDLGERIGLIDVTTHDASSDTRTKIDAGFKEPAKISFDLVYDPANTVHNALRAGEDTHAVRTVVISVPDSVTTKWWGSVRVASFSVSAPVADKLSAKVTLELVAASTYN